MVNAKVSEKVQGHYNRWNPFTGTLDQWNILGLVLRQVMALGGHHIPNMKIVENPSLVCAWLHIHNVLTKGVQH